MGLTTAVALRWHRWPSAVSCQGFESEQRKRLHLERLHDVTWCDVTSREVMWQPDALKRVQLKTSRNPVKKKKSKRISSLSRAPENTDTTTDNVDNATTSTTPTTSTPSPTPTQPHSTSCSRRKENLGQGQNRVSKERTKILIGCVFNWERNNPLWKKILAGHFEASNERP